MNLDQLANFIIETPEFQRLKQIRQLGCCSFVYKNAKHTRFEHSIDVYLLARKQIFHLQAKHPELNITDRECITVSLSALLHDLGHLCFSHLFDEWLQSKKIESPLIEHELRSCVMIDYLVLKYNLPLSAEEVSMMKQMIHPTKIPKERRFLYQIIANKDNNLDTDKICYIYRDANTLSHPAKDIIFPEKIVLASRIINHNICYEESSYLDILNIFTTRYVLHREYYNSADTKSVDIIMKKLFDEIDESDKILSSSINSIDRCLKLSDDDIFKLGKERKCPAYEQLISKSWMKCVARFKLSSVVASNTDFHKFIEEFNKNENVKLVPIKIGLVSGNRKNPLKHLSFYRESDVREDTEIHTYTMNNFVLFIDSYQETILYMYCMDISILPSDMINNIIVSIEKFRNEKALLL